MKRKRFSTEQITAVLQQAEQGVPIGELCRQVGISEQSFYRWNGHQVIPGEACRTDGAVVAAQHGRGRCAHAPPRHVLIAIQAEADAGVAARAQADPIAGRHDILVGIGPVLALTIRAEIGDIARFRLGAELASYAGLMPRVDASAGRYWTGPITREGSPWLRWAFFAEAAMHGVRRPDALGRWARLLAVRKGAFKARVALARRLCDEIVAVWPRVTFDA